MAKPRVPLNQTAIEVPLQPGGQVATLSPEDQELEYARLMGEAALRRQRELHEEEHRCTCGNERESRIKMHKPGCKRRPIRKNPAAR